MHVQSINQSIKQPIKLPINKLTNKLDSNQQIDQQNLYDKTRHWFIYIIYMLHIAGKTAGTMG